MDERDPDWSALRSRAYPVLMEDFLRRTRLADPAMVEWAAPLILAAEGDSRSIARQLRLAGEPLSLQERRERGFAPRLQIGRLFADALLPPGLEDVDAAALAISHHPFAMLSRAQMRWLCQYDGVRARMLIRSDEKTCLAARPYIKRILPLADLPVFPLAECDKMVCRCNFDRSNTRDRRPRSVKPELLPEFLPLAPPPDAARSAPREPSAFGLWFGRILKWALLGPIIAIGAILAVALVINAIRILAGV